MKLGGSRSRQEEDAFSDWDYRVESPSDYGTVEQQLLASVAWKTFSLPDLRGVTLINQQGVLFDYTCTLDSCGELWEAIQAREDHDKIRDYWIITFKHLKALYRGLDPFCSLGLELSTGRARDIFFTYILKVDNYGSFYNFKRISAMPGIGHIEQIVGLSYRTRKEKIEKILALNQLVVEALPGFSDDANRAFGERLLILQQGTPTCE